MKKILFTLFASLICFGASAQITSSNEWIDHLSVQGHAQREVAPDEIFITFTLDEQSGRGKATLQKQESDLIAALDKLGIDSAKDLQATRMINDVQYYIFKKDKINQTKTYQLKLGSAEMVNKVFEQFALLNISMAKISRMSRSDINLIRDELRVEALHNAEKIATSMASALGYGLGRPIYIGDNTSTYDFTQFDEMPHFRYDDNIAISARGVQETTVQFKNIKVESDVTVYFEFGEKLQ